MKKVSILIIVSLLFSCGYSIRKVSELPYREIEIGTVQNRTFEPDIEDILEIKLTDELSKQGFLIKNTAAHKITGTITNFDLKVVSEKDQFSREYEVVIMADIVLTGPDGFELKLINVRSPFIESFTAETDINSIISFKELATERALGSFANRIVSEVIYK